MGTVSNTKCCSLDYGDKAHSQVINRGWADCVSWVLAKKDRGWGSEKSMSPPDSCCRCEPGRLARRRFSSCKVVQNGECFSPCENHERLVWQSKGLSSGVSAVSSVVEHFLDTEGVRGSNPLSRTIPFHLKSLAKSFIFSHSMRFLCLSMA